MNNKGESGLEALLALIVLVVVSILVWGWFSNVVIGKMNTGQYIQKVQQDIQRIGKELPPKIEKAIERVTNTSKASVASVASDKPEVEKIKTPLEKVMEQARRNLKLPQFAEIPNARGVSPEEKDFQKSPYYFTSDMIDALKFVWDGDKLSKELNKKSDEEVNEKMYEVFLEKMRLLQSAISVMEPYTKSSDERISKTAKVVAMVLIQQFNYNFDMLAFLKHLNTYVPETDKDIKDAYQIISEMNYEIQRIRKEYEGSYKYLLNAVIMVSHILVDQTPDASGHFSSLSITALQKAKLIQQMEKSFGVIPPFGEGELSLSEGAVSALYYFLTTSKHTPKA